MRVYKRARLSLDLQIVCQDKKVVVAEAKVSCEQLLVAIVQDKRVADEQEKQVSYSLIPAVLNTPCKSYTSSAILALLSLQYKQAHGIVHACLPAVSKCGMKKAQLEPATHLVAA